MAGMIKLSNSRKWTVRGGLFYWAVRVLARNVQDELVAARLREIDEAGLVGLFLEDFPQDEQTVILRAICSCLLPAAETEFVSGPARGPALAFVREIVAAACDSLNQSHSVSQ